MFHKENAKLIKTHAKFCATCVIFSLCEFLFFHLCVTFNVPDSFLILILSYLALLQYFEKGNLLITMYKSLKG